MLISLKRTCSALVAMMYILGISPVHAAITEFTLDQTQSMISIVNTSASSPFGSATGTPTAPGNSNPVLPDGFHARFGGTLSADVTDNSFQLLTSTLQVLDLNSYLPGPPTDNGSSTVPGDIPVPASYAVTHDPFFSNGQAFNYALRGLEITFRDGTAKSLTNGEFEAAGIEVKITDGEAHLSLGNPPVTDLLTIPEASRTTSNVDTGMATLTTDGLLQTLIIPFNYTLTLPALIATTTEYQGQLVATRIIPEPTTAILLSAGALALLSRRRLLLRS